MGILTPPSHIIMVSDMHLDDPHIGTKAKNLKILKDASFLVPDFVVISGDILKNIDANDSNRVIGSILYEIGSSLPGGSYAVRSAALMEDSSVSSMAGQFHTEIDVDYHHLHEAISRVIGDARSQLDGDLRDFSIIIQRYIQADIAGVCFTRNPTGGREMMFEYHHGIGEDLVSGSITPTRQISYWGEKRSICDQESRVFQDIESLFGMAQDIEWCIAGGTLYILQSRPITTISREQYSDILELENYLPQGTDFFLTKNEICEIAPHPSTHTLSLLDRIYGDGGPVMRAYARHHIHYTPPTHMFWIVGRELYIDRESELQTLLPAWSILQSDYRPRLAHWRGILHSLQNLFWLTIMGEPSDLVSRFRAILSHPIRRESFLDDYSVIFEINLIASRRIHDLQTLIKNESISFVEILSCNDMRIFGADTAGVEINLGWDLGGLRGNTLDITDMSVFSTTIHHTGQRDMRRLSDWWCGLPTWKQRAYGPRIIQTLTYQQYREYARILMVSHIHHMRSSLMGDTHDLDPISISSHKKIHTGENLYGHWIEEENQSPILGISHGQAQGIVMRQEDIQKSSNKSCILLTENLSPDLVQFFNQIEGIISRRGGYLSHLAIMARERGIPVIIHSSMPNEIVGREVVIDGGTGEMDIL